MPGRLAMPPVTPLRAPHTEGLSNGTSGEGTQHATNGSTAPSNDDTHMTDSQDLNANTQHDFQFQTPSRIEGQGTQTQKSQMSGRTFMAPNSHPNDYHNSASTTTSGQKTSNRSSDNKFGTQSSNGAAPSGVPNFSEMMPEPNGSQLPDTQGSPTPFHQRLQVSTRFSPEHNTDHVSNTEVHYVSSQPSNSQPSQPSQSSQHVTFHACACTSAPLES